MLERKSVRTINHPARACWQVDPLERRVLLSAASAASGGFAGDLDPTFGTGGMVSLAVPLSRDDRATAIAFSDGKVIVAGASADLGGFSEGPALAQYNADGTPDTMFGPGGRKPIDRFDSSGGVVDVFPRPGEGFLIADGIGRIFRYTSDGERDEAFGDYGFAAVEPGRSANVAILTVSAPGGGILVNAAGTLRRLTPDGQPDAQFEKHRQANLAGDVVAAAVQRGGNILALSDSGLQRLKASGKPDRSFGRAGRIEVPASDRLLVALPNGRFLVGGADGDGTLVLRGYTASGRPDAKFGTGAAVDTGFDAPAGAQGGGVLGFPRVVPRSDGSVYILGYTGGAATLACLDARGNPVASFVPPTFAADLAPAALAVDPGGSLYVVATRTGELAGSFGSANPADFVLLHFNVHGAPDASFGTGGSVTTDFLTATDVVAMDGALAPSGQILVAGSYGDSFPHTSEGGVIARLNADGSLDATFGSSGAFFTGSANSAVAVQADGKVLAASGGMIRRYHHDGGLDAAFGVGGTAAPQLVVNRLIGQPDAKILLAGSGGSNADFVLARLTADGHPDIPFGDAGTVVTDLRGYQSSDQPDGATDVAFTPDGKMVVAGVTTESDETNLDGSSYSLIAFARYNANGSIDTSFGTGGTTAIALDARPTSVPFFRRVDLSLLTGGEIGFGAAGDDLFATGRLDSDGRLDPAYGDAAGVVTTDASFDAFFTTSALAPDGRVVVAGITDTYDFGGSSSFLLSRLDAQGDRDPGFGRGQVRTVVERGINGAVRANLPSVLLQSDGNVVAVGTGRPVEDSAVRIALTRYLGDAPPSPPYTPGPAPARLLEDVAPDLATSAVQTTVALGTRAIYAVIKQGAYQVWASDGTGAGTLPLTRDLGGAEPFDVIPERVRVIGGTMFFVAQDVGAVESIANPNVLWGTDGTPGGTVPLRGGVGDISAIVALNGALLFTVEEPDGQSYLWRTDGTEAGTALVRKVGTRVNLTGTAPAHPVIVGNSLFFTATDADGNAALWKTDGTEAGTVMVKAVPADRLLAAGDTVFFTADSGLWRSDGTEAGTIRLGEAHLQQVTIGSAVALGDKLFFFQFGDQPSLWVSDGTEVGTVQFARQSGSLFVAGGRLFCFSGGDLWSSNGRKRGMRLIGHFSVEPGFFGSDDVPSNFVEFNGKFLFTASDAIHHRALWASDGTRRGTVLLRDVEPLPSSTNSPTPSPFVQVGGSTLYFLAADDEHGTELWASDGTPKNTRLVADINPGPHSSDPRTIVVAGDRLLFSADDATHGRELWASDGTNGGTALLTEIEPGPNGSSPDQLTVAGGALFFTAFDAPHGWKRWVVTLP